ncbi:hypothetical protein FHS16_002174 [Paenibacillus endophyticus]|uniref:Flagellar hook-length control protein-like C-terminal domain-containing protein n=1 Tax=Paenibacillus endophyticus TaxID=1294268 RepID=A0A7W5C6S7_9BACL|nr:hypothetical protein [Paenibacillus endophyticus]MBB3152128.1 hypothetical protein [Paenibacillus endophyticus]
MNISQMMRSFLGEASGSDTRAVELKVGQVVRGVVLQVMENNEALIQINGVQVRAKLEIPMQVGQTAMLQVQPQSSGALVMLKPVEPGQVGLPEDTFKEWAKQLALPEQKWAAQIVKELRKEGLILNRDVAQAFQQAAAAMPPDGDAEQWMQSAAATYKRGLPMTGATIGAMQQVMFGRSAHELLDTLQMQLSAHVSDSDAETSENKPVNQAAARVQVLLNEGMELLRGATAGNQASQASNSVDDAALGLLTGKQQAAPNGKTEIQHQAAAATARQIGAASAADDTLPQTIKAANNQPNWLGQMMKWMGVDHELQLAKAVASDSQKQQPVANPAQAANPAEFTSQTSSGETARQSATIQNAAASHIVTPQIADDGSLEASASKLLQSVTSETDMSAEQQQGRAIDSRNVVERTAAAVVSVLADSLQAPDGSPPAQQESLKSALLALVSSDSTPPAIKETAQQLVQQITGQQLLLTPERNNSVLTHVTMFIPLNSPDGKQTASVHIQTRRGRKGELDSSNCRLLFNLSMNTLGNTMVDVNVMDKIVSLNIWNDHPAIAALAESSRGEIASSIQDAGYQLLSLRTTPLPKETIMKPEETDGASMAPKTNPMADLAAFSSNRYKGVDYRI